MIFLKIYLVLCFFIYYDYRKWQLTFSEDTLDGKYSSEHCIQIISLKHNVTGK